MKIVPKLANGKKTVDYTTIESGEIFMSDNRLYVKFDNDDYDQLAIPLGDGDNFGEDMCGKEVIPINVEIRWSYRPQPKAKPKK